MEPSSILSCLQTRIIKKHHHLFSPPQENSEIGKHPSVQWNPDMPVKLQPPWPPPTPHRAHSFSPTQRNRLPKHFQSDRKMRSSMVGQYMDPTIERVMQKISIYIILWTLYLTCYLTARYLLTCVQSRVPVRWISCEKYLFHEYIVQ